MFSCTQKGCLHLGLLLENIRAPEDSSRLQMEDLEHPRPEAHWLPFWCDSRLQLQLGSFFSTGQEDGRSYAIVIAKELSIWHIPGVQLLEGLYPKLWGLPYSWLKCLTKAWNVNFYCWKYNLRYLCSSLWEGLLLIQGIKSICYALSCQYNQLILSMLFFSHKQVQAKTLKMEWN